jgi:multidrug efflux pump subunit AcrA (membrane-fusion protein)
MSESKQMKRSLWIGCVILLIVGGALSATPIVRSWFHERLPFLGINGVQIQEQPQSAMDAKDSLPLVNIDMPRGVEVPLIQSPISSSGFESKVQHAQAILPAPQQGTATLGSLPAARSQEAVQFPNGYPVPSGPTARLAQSGGIGIVPREGIEVPTASSSGRILIPQASLIFKRDIPLAAPVDGLIMQLNADDGVSVKSGEPLVIIDSRIAEAEVKVQTQELEQAKLKANDNSSELFAEAAHEVAKVDFARSNELSAKGSESDSDNEKKGLELKKAGLQIKVAKIESAKNQAAVGVAEAKLDAAFVQVGLRTMNAPFDGLVYEVNRRQFEFVRTGDPIFRLTDMTQLRVQGQAQTTVPPNQLLNSKARITIEIAPGVTKNVEGVVGHVSPKTTKVANMYAVWVEIPNEPLPDGQFRFRGGMNASMEILLKDN